MKKGLYKKQNENTSDLRTDTRLQSYTYCSIWRTGWKALRFVFIYKTATEITDTRTHPFFSVSAHKLFFILTVQIFSFTIFILVFLLIKASLQSFLTWLFKRNERNGQKYITLDVIKILKMSG